MASLQMVARDVRLQGLSAAFGFFSDGRCLGITGACRCHCRCEGRCFSHPRRGCWENEFHSCGGGRHQRGECAGSPPYFLYCFAATTGSDRQPHLAVAMWPQRFPEAVERPQETAVVFTRGSVTGEENADLSASSISLPFDAIFGESVGAV
ncbi:hypothetical protein TcCL_ESM07055 [Trypanosoma cruzi]|nr:hypothetical protein TcCL_ESM07055 [Trypanosoma cruzi]